RTVHLRSRRRRARGPRGGIDMPGRLPRGCSGPGPGPRRRAAPPSARSAVGRGGAFPATPPRSGTSTKVEVDGKGWTMSTGPAWNRKELSVGQVAARSGVSVSALHFYERKGLIASRRTSGNQRRYRRDILRRVALIRVAQRVGIQLAEISSALAELPDGRTPNRQDWQMISARTPS